MVEYHAADGSKETLKVWDTDSYMWFDEGGGEPGICLDRDSVAALVGQLQSWLARTAKE